MSLSGTRECSRHSAESILFAFRTLVTKERLHLLKLVDNNLFTVKENKLPEHNTQNLEDVSVREERKRLSG